MKKMFSAFVLSAMLLSLAGCAKEATINGKTVDPYGLINQDAKKEPGVQYQISPVAVIVSIIFVETVIVPVYIVGWDLYEPVTPN